LSLGCNASPLTVHIVIIILKIFVIFFYAYFKPYLRQGFNFFKIIQEMHFIMVSIFLICLDDIGKDIEKNVIIEEDLVESFLAMGERLL
jgi:hypothetical protein